MFFQSGNSRKAAVFGSILLLTGSLYGFDLVKGGKTAEIVLPENAYPSTKLAAEELAEYVGKVTGKKPQVVTGKSSAANKIYIGTPDTLKNLPVSAAKALKSAKQNEAHFICAKGNTLYIIGKQEVADLYATYQFIEDKLGVRWLKIPDKFDSGEYVPKKAEITFADYEKFREPAFSVRRLDQCGSFWNVIPVQGKTWATRNGYQTPAAYGMPYGDPDSFRYKFYTARIPRTAKRFPGGSHATFTMAMPPDTYFSRHPEYFALVDGKRVKGKQYCLSNPEVRRNVANYIIRELDKTSGAGTFNFGMVDISTGWCECAECRKLDGKDTTAEGLQNVSTRFQKTVRAIAEMVYKKYPNADLSVWAYSAYRQLPEGVKIHPKMKFQFCLHGRCYGHALDDPNCPRNVRLYKLFLDWLKVSPKEVFTYEYFMSTHAYYCCEETVQALDLRLYKKLGLAGYKEEGLFPDSKFTSPKKNGNRAEWMPSNWQWAYVTAKLLWDPDQDENKLLDEVESLYYGKAYPAMKKYHALRRKLWSGTPQCLGYPHGDTRTAYALNAPEAGNQLKSLLDEADKLAAGDKLMQYRLANDRRWLTEYWIKPNKKLKELAGKTMRAPDTKSKIVIDGDGRDRAWVGAYYLTSGLKQPYTEKKEDLPEALKTTLGILSDENNLYFLITAQEPSPEKLKANGKPGSAAVYQDDSIEIFLYPPTAANTYYHLIVNSKGAMFDAEGNNVDFNIPVEVKTKVHRDRYVIEVRVPLGKLKKPERGEIWHINFARNRRIDDALTPAKIKGSGSFSLDGCNYHDIAAFRPLEIGTPYVRNGSFDELDENGKPKFWNLGKNSTVEKSGSGHAVRVNGDIHQGLTVGELKQQPFERKIIYSFKASGKGKLQVRFFRYTDTPDPKEKKRYRRTFHRPYLVTATFEVTEQPKLYQGKYTIAPNEWVAFDLVGKGILVDDVSVRLDK